jgi:hypothetical protein
VFYCTASYKRRKTSHIPGDHVAVKVYKQESILPTLNCTPDNYEQTNSIYSSSYSAQSQPLCDKKCENHAPKLLHFKELQTVLSTPSYGHLAPGFTGGFPIRIAPRSRVYTPSLLAGLPATCPPSVWRVLLAGPGPFSFRCKRKARRTTILVRRRRIRNTCPGEFARTKPDEPRTSIPDPRTPNSEPIDPRTTSFNGPADHTYTLLREYRGLFLPTYFT